MQVEINPVTPVTVDDGLGDVTVALNTAEAESLSPAVPIAS